MQIRVQSRIDQIIHLSTEIKESEARILQMKERLAKLIGPSPNTHPRGKKEKTKAKASAEKRQRMSRADAARIPSLILRFVKKKGAEVPASDIISGLKLKHSAFFRSVNQLLKQKDVIRVSPGLYKAAN